MGLVAQLLQLSRAVEQPGVLKLINPGGRLREHTAGTNGKPRKQCCYIIYVYRQIKAAFRLSLFSVQSII